MKKIRVLSALAMLILGYCVSMAQSGTYTLNQQIEVNSDDTDAQGFTFIVNDVKNLTLTCNNTSRTGDAAIPAKVRDKYNTEFTVNRATFLNKNLSQCRVILPETITEIQANSFNHCNVIALVIPKTVSTISPDCGLTDSKNLEEIIVDDENPYFTTDSEHTMVYNKVPNASGVVQVYAFTRYKLVDGSPVGIKEITIPEGVTTSVSPESELIEVINLPSSYNKFDSNKCFGSATLSSLKAVNVDSNNPVFTNYNGDGIVYTKDMTEVCLVPSKKFSTTDTFDIPAGVTTINNRAFFNTDLYTVNFNDVTTIGNNAFTDSEIKTIHIGDKVETLGKEIFSYCRTLANVTMGPKITSIPSSTFYLCASLGELTIGSGVTEIGDGIISLCDKIKEINVASDNIKFAAVDGILYARNSDTQVKDTLVLCPGGREKEVIIPDEVLVIRGGAFRYCEKIEKITLGNNVKWIGSHAFTSCSGIDNFYIGPSVEMVDNCAFDRTKANTITIGNCVTHLGTGAFEYSSKLEHIFFEPESQVDSIYHNTFYQTAIKDIVIPRSVKYVTGSAFAKSSLENLVFEDGSILSEISPFTETDKLKTIDFGKASPDTHLAITANAFSNMKLLESVKLPSSITNIATNAFFNCPNLKTVEFDDNENEVTIGNFAFASTAIERLDFPKKLVKIGAGVFNSCDNLTEVHIPETTSSIHHQAFIMCKSLLNINVDKENPTYATSDGMLLNKAQTKLLTFPGGKANDKFTLLSPSIEEIGDSAFYFCQNLKNITIPKKVKRIGNYAFQFCDNLTHINFLTDGLVENFESDVAENNASSDPNKKDHRFGNATVSAKDFVKNLTITVRKNGNEDQYDESNYWKDCPKVYSFIDEDGINEYLPTGRGDALLLASNSTKHSTVIPATISDGQNTYRVSVGDYAFEDIDPAVKEIIFEGPVDYMGACAFKDFETQTSNIENVFLTTYDNLGVHELSTKRFNLPAEKYQTIFSSGQQHIYVPKSVEDTFKEDWTSHADNISYKIPGIKIGSKYGTFSREFDVDLEDEDANWDEENSRPNVAAFTGYVKTVVDEDRDYTYIVMRSINCEEESKTTVKGSGDGTYIPANTGVLLRAYTDGKTPDGFYYRIGEQKSNFEAPQENVMMTVTETGTTIMPTDGDFTNYVISGGKYYSLTGPTNIPVHKSYIHVKEEKESKGIKLVFASDGETTGIEEITPETRNLEPETIYNLNGQRVNGNAKGIVIKNGKKIFVK